MGEKFVEGVVAVEGAGADEFGESAEADAVGPAFGRLVGVLVCSVEIRSGHSVLWLTVALGSLTTLVVEFIVVSMLTGAHEELRALRWTRVHLDGAPSFIEVRRSMRMGGDTKTRRSRRTVALPGPCVDALRLEAERQSRDRYLAVPAWQETGRAPSRWLDPAKPEF